MMRITSPVATGRSRLSNQRVFSWLWKQSTWRRSRLLSSNRWTCRAGWRRTSSPSAPASVSASATTEVSCAHSLPVELGADLFAEVLLRDFTDGGRGKAIPQLQARSEEHTSELQSLAYLVCRLLLEKKTKT